ncbi:hypothetical protein PHPALM_31249 [Phytophthora palmivora]|uniref:CCHC-type domain-containing protein n=1 Tax=Phytophthora palmivora TaxID=4796 RepID=A0A2P4X323_9STRA|nr:hypothetical protein PHPALM_31249 [Phytophthora palmivora]
MTGGEELVVVAGEGTPMGPIASTKRQRRDEEQAEVAQGAPCGPHREGELVVVSYLTPQQWNTLEAGFSKTKMQVVFSMDETSVAVGNLYWTLHDFERDILTYCRSQGVTFGEGRLDALDTDKIVVHAALVESRIVVTGFSAEVSAREIETAFERHGLSRVSVEIRSPRRNYAVVELANCTAVEEAIDRFGEAFPNSLRVGNIALRIKKLNDPNNQGCFMCGKTGHFRRTCPDNKPAWANRDPATTGVNSQLVGASNGNQAANRLVESMVEGMISKRSRQLEHQVAQVHSGVTALWQSGSAKSQDRRSPLTHGARTTD